MHICSYSKITLLSLKLYRVSNPFGKPLAVIKIYSLKSDMLVLFLFRIPSLFIYIFRTGFSYLLLDIANRNVGLVYPN